MKSLSKGKMWCYAIGQLGWSIISGLIGSWLVYFYQPNQEAINDGMISLIPQGRVVLGVLTANRQSSSVPDPFIASYFHQSLDVEGNLSS